jgi:hypothetical protein
MYILDAFNLARFLQRDKGQACKRLRACASTTAPSRILVARVDDRLSTRAFHFIHMAVSSSLCNTDIKKYFLRP